MLFLECMWFVTVKKIMLYIIIYIVRCLDYVNVYLLRTKLKLWVNLSVPVYIWIRHNLTHVHKMIGVAMMAYGSTSGTLQG